ncbi:MAG: hypothetical protein LBR49_01100 [Tannerella sp.]|jgi:hypothetical protein|nr:hypothetical protein [Tannerella sp.]
MRQRLNIGTNEATEKNNSGQNLLRQTAGSLNGRQFAFPLSTESPNGTCFALPLSAGTVNALSARVPSIYIQKISSANSTQTLSATKQP